MTARLRKDLPRRSSLATGRSTSDESTNDQRQSIPVIRIGIGHPIDKWLYPFLAPFAARKLKPDIIHGILETFAGLALWFCKFLVPNAKRILTLQTTNRSFLKGMIIRSPDVVTVISAYLMMIAEKLGRKNVKLIPNGIDVAAFQTARTQHRKIPGRVLFVGRLEQVKGVEDVIKAFAIVRGEHPSASLHVVGSGSLLLQLTQEHHGKSGIQILGPMAGESLLKEYAEAEIFCGLSKSEAMGNVFIESQAAGCAVVATNVGGIPENVSGGIIVELGDTQAAARAIAALLRDHAQRKDLAEKGTAMAKRFDWSGIAKQYEILYKTWS